MPTYLVANDEGARAGDEAAYAELDISVDALDAADYGGEDSEEDGEVDDAFVASY